MYVQYNLDILKPHLPSNDTIARALYELEGVKYVGVKIDEIDQKTTSVFVTIKGTKDLSLEEIKEALEENNCAVHSVDNVIVADEDFCKGHKTAMD